MLLVTNRSGRRATSQNFSKLLSLLSKNSTPLLPKTAYLIAPLFPSRFTGFLYKPPPPRILHRPYSLLTFMNATPLHSINSAIISQQSHPTQTDNPFSMQPMHLWLPWFSDQDKIRRHSWIEAARFTLISVPGFTQATQPWSLGPVTRCSATGTFTMLPCIPYCPYPHSWRFCAKQGELQLDICLFCLTSKQIPCLVYYLQYNPITYIILIHL
jgi:hypothetical protein